MTQYRPDQQINSVVNLYCRSLMYDSQWKWRHVIFIKIPSPYYIIRALIAGEYPLCQLRVTREPSDIQPRSSVVPAFALEY